MEKYWKCLKVAWILQRNLHKRIERAEAKDFTLLLLFLSHYVSPRKTCRTVSMLSATGALADAHCAANFLGNNYSAEVIYSSHNSCGFHLYKNLLDLRICTVSICKTRRFILFIRLLVSLTKFKL